MMATSWHYYRPSQEDDMEKIGKYFVQGPVTPEFIAESLAKHQSKTSIGAHSMFMGQVRADEADREEVIAIDYSAYPEMAEKIINEFREPYFQKYDLSCLHIHHSIGEVKVGELSLFIFVSAPHRADCIAAITELVEDVKFKVPVWKKELMTDGSHRWVDGPPEPVTD